MRVKLLSHGFQCIPKKENTFLKSLRKGEIFFMRAHAVLIGSDVSKLQICYQQIHEFKCIFFLRNMMRQIKCFAKTIIQYKNVLSVIIKHELLLSFYNCNEICTIDIILNI